MPQGEPNASKTHCRSGHEYTPENTWVSRSRDGYVRRGCRRCGALRSRERFYLIREQARARGSW